MTEIAAPDPLQFARKFHAAGPWGDVPLDEAALRTFFAALADAGYLAVREGGFIGGVVQPLYFAPDTLVAVELFWWSDDPRTGAELREGFETWAREKGASFAGFSSLVNERETATRRLYRRAGFEPVEIAYRKGL